MKSTCECNTCPICLNRLRVQKHRTNKTNGISATPGRPKRKADIEAVKELLSTINRMAYLDYDGQRIFQLSKEARKCKMSVPELAGLICQYAPDHIKLIMTPGGCGGHFKRNVEYFDTLRVNMAQPSPADWRLRESLKLD